MAYKQGRNTLMIAKITPGLLSGQVIVPGSKSETHRAYICAALSEGESFIRGACICADTVATRRALSALGAQFTDEEEGIRVRGGLRRGERITVDCAESGSTLRFLLPVALALGGEYHFTGAPRLYERPNEALIRALSGEGVTIERSEGGLIASGRLSPRVYSVDASLSSQYITGLLLALPLVPGAKLRPLGKRVSGSYVDITTRMMESFGVNAAETANVYTVQGTYTPGEVSVGGDWSSAAFWLAAGALGSDIRVQNLDILSAQGDREAFEVLTAMGAQARREGGCVRVQSDPMTGLVIDASNIPDLVPILAVTACFARGTTQVTGAARLRGKESDRLAAVRELIEHMGGIAHETPDGLQIHGLPLRGGEVDAWGDHRIAMSAAIAATAGTQPTYISGAQCVEKSYPDFFAHFAAMGGQVEWLAEE